MDVINLLEKPTEAIYQNEDFRWVLEHHMDIIRASALTGAPPDILFQENHRNNFYEVLAHQQVPKHLHWLTARVNGVIDPANWPLFKESMLYIPEPSGILTSLITLYRTNNK